MASVWNGRDVEHLARLVFANPFQTHLLIGLRDVLAPFPVGDGIHAGDHQQGRVSAADVQRVFRIGVGGGAVAACRVDMLGVVQDAFHHGQVGPFDAHRRQKVHCRQESQQ